MDNGGETITQMIETEINGRWKLLLPYYRAERIQWPDWETDRLASMYDHLRRGDVIYDVGTEEGDLTGLYALWGCEVAMIEPNELVWPNIKLIWEANGLEKPLAWVRAFASDENVGDIEFGIHGWPECVDLEPIRAHGFSELGESPDAPCIRLDALSVLTDKPDAITIDVEGAELLVLKGASGLLRCYSPLVWVSIHPTMIGKYGATREDVSEFMESFGYTATHLAIDHEEHWFFEKENMNA